MTSFGVVIILVIIYYEIIYIDKIQVKILDVLIKLEKNMSIKHGEENIRLGTPRRYVPSLKHTISINNNTNNNNNNNTHLRFVDNFKQTKKIVNSVDLNNSQDNSKSYELLFV